MIVVEHFTEKLSLYKAKIRLLFSGEGGFGAITKDCKLPWKLENVMVGKMRIIACSEETALNVEMV